MPIYHYRARDEAGKQVNGTMDAASSDELATKLHKMGYMVTSLDVASGGMRNFINIPVEWQMVKAQDLLIFNFQLANMLESGISILNALRTIEGQIENKKLKNVIADVHRNIEAGGFFSASLNNHPLVFSKLFINMVKAGEESGKLSEVLKRYALFSEAQAELKEKVKGALFYPALLFVASILVIIFIVTFIIPQFVELFQRIGVTLPLITQVLYNLGIVIKRYWYVILAAIIGLLLLVRKYLSSQAGRKHLDRFILRFPVIGALSRKIYVSRFSRTLATLLSSGVPILQSLDIVKEVVGNTVIADVVSTLRQSVEGGQKISEPLRISQQFPADAVAMIAIGEETGNLEEMLNKVADFYDMAVGFSVKKLTTLIEPVFLLIMGSVVAFIMVSMLMPIFDMVKILRH